MSESNSIMRTATAVEKKQFIPIGKKGPINKSYLEVKQLKIRELEKDYHSKKIPFDRYSALLDLQDAIDTYIKEYKRRVGNMTKISEALFENDIFSTEIIKTYAGKSRFKLIETKDIWTDKLIDNMKQTIQDKKEVIYEGERGNRISMFMYNEEYFKLFKKTPKPEVK